MYSHYEHKKLIIEAQNNIKGLKRDHCDLTHYWGELELSPGCQACKQGSWYCIFVTRFCNRSCSYCTQDNKFLNNKDLKNIQLEETFVTERKGKSFTEESFKQMLENSHDVVSGVSYSGGEPFLALDRVIRLADICNQVKPELYQWIYSNGAYVTKANLKTLQQRNLKEIRFDWAAQNFNPKLLRKMEMAANIGFKVVVEIPMFNREIIRNRFIPLLGEMVSAGVSQLNCAELMLRKQNENDLQISSDELYLHENGQRSPVWSRQLTYEIMAQAEAQNLKLLINDCSNDTKLLQIIQRSRRLEPEKKYLREIIELSLTGEGELSSVNSKSLDRDFINLEVSKHQLQEFFYYNFRDHPEAKLLPEGLIDEWKNYAAGKVVRNALFRKYFHELLNQLTRCSIDYILLNGAAHADERKSYKLSAELNNFVFLINRDDLTKVSDVLLSEGYVIFTQTGLNGNTFSDYQYGGEQEESITFSKKSGVLSFYVKLLTDIPLSAKVNAGDAKRRSTDYQELACYEEPLFIGGVRAGSLNPSAYLAYLIHTYTLANQLHGWRWFVEICLVLSYYQETISFDAAADLADQLQSRPLFDLVITAAVEMLKKNILDGKGQTSSSGLCSMLNYTGYFRDHLAFIDWLDAKPASKSMVEN